ncbi:hypothetical protein GCM10010174_49170 [Kutzneria viridogrisea]
MTAATTERTVPGVGCVTLPLPTQRFVGQCGQPTRTAIAEAAAFAVNEAEHARYRWLLGHQAAFCVWRLLADLLRSALAQPDEAQPQVAVAAHLVDAYSVLLLYSGSCSTEIYHSTIRPEMIAAHPAFSGKWSRDYEPLPALIRASRSVLPAQAKGLAASAKANQLVHMAIADKLVPQGQSLLRAASGSGPVVTSEVERDLFDQFFLVQRRPVSKEVLIGQLGERLDRIAADLMASPLPEPPWRDTEPVMWLHRNSAGILAEATGWLREVSVGDHAGTKGRTWASSRTSL